MQSLDRSRERLGICTSGSEPESEAVPPALRRLQLERRVEAVRGPGKARMATSAPFWDPETGISISWGPVRAARISWEGWGLDRAAVYREIVT